MSIKVLIRTWEAPAAASNDGLEDDLKAGLSFVERGATRYLIEPLEGLGGRYEAFRSARAGARFHPDEKIWTADAEVTARIVDRLEKAGFVAVIHPEVRAAIDREVAIVEASVKSAVERLAKLEERLSKKGRALFDYQRRDVLWLASRKRAINCSEMGTGKTAVALASLPPSSEVGVIVACPKTAKGVWRVETSAWRDDFEVTTFSGRGSFRYPKRGEVTIINYDIIPNLKDLPTLPDYPITLIGDEAHLLKNSRSQRTVRFSRLVEVADRVLLLTGTPLPNKPSELWSLLLLARVAHEAFGTYKEFCRVFDGKKKFFGGMEWGKPLPESGQYLERVLIRHMKADVLKDLPPKIHGVVEVDIEDKLSAILSGSVGADGILKAKDISEVPFAQISSLRKLLADAKTEAAIELAESYEEADTPVVFFSMHRAPIDALGMRPGWAAITGDTKDVEREKIARDFQTGLLKGVAATIQAAATALTLTRSTNEVFVDLSYVPSDNEQAEARCHRIGTKSTVTILHMVCTHPIDQHLRLLIAKKQGIIDASVNSSAARKDKPQDLKALIPQIPPRQREVVSKSGPRRSAKTQAEKDALCRVYLLSGLEAGDPGVKVMLADKRIALDIGAEAMTCDGRLSEAQWRTAMWVCKKYPRKP